MKKLPYFAELSFHYKSAFCRDDVPFVMIHGH